MQFSCYSIQYPLANSGKSRKRRGRIARLVRYFYLRITRKNDSPERLGRGVFIGVFVGIFPTLWFGPALTLALAGLLQANRGAALLGSFVCGPLTPVTWTLAAVLGNQLVHPDYRVAAHLLTWENRNMIAERFFVTFLLGNVIVSFVFALAGYALVWWFAARRKDSASNRTPTAVR